MNPCRVVVADISQRLEAIYEQLEDAKTAIASLLVLREQAFMVAALEDALGTFQTIQNQTLQAIVVVELILRDLERGRNSRGCA
jgi:hypothetical protein